MSITKSSQEHDEMCQIQCRDGRFQENNHQDIDEFDLVREIDVIEDHHREK